MKSTNGLIKRMNAFGTFPREDLAADRQRNGRKQMHGLVELRVLLRHEMLIEPVLREVQVLLGHVIQMRLNKEKLIISVN
jgi:hypothetical protein